MTSRRSDAVVDIRPGRQVSRSRATPGRRSRDRHADAEPAPTGRVFVLDTSVLLSDPAAFRRFADHEVVIPLVVISELEGKRHHPELGWFARQSLRMLDELRIKYGRLDQPVLCNDEGGTLRVELNHADQSVLPHGFRNDSNDTRILSVALGPGRRGPGGHAGQQGHAAAGQGGLGRPDRRRVPARPGQRPDLDRHGRAEARRGAGRPRCTRARSWSSRRPSSLPCHTGLVIHSPRGSALGRVNPDKTVRLVRGDREAFGLRGRSAEQRIALDLLLDESIGIVSLGGRAGTGKSALALCAGLEATMERNRHKKVIVFRPLYAVGGQELGYLPGTESEKMSPWAQAVFDTLGAVVHENVMEEVMARGMLEVLPLTHIRGRSLHDAFVIVDEAQSLERNVLLTVLSRIGQGSRVVLTHDVAQRDNLRVGRHDGVTAVIEALKGHPIFAHVTLDPVRAVADR